MNYHKIIHDDQLNGDGLRVTLFVSGCNNHCKGCQNKQTWDPKSGKLFDEKAKNEIMYYLSKDYISGLTLSGGDPLFSTNMYTIFDLCVDSKVLYPNKNIWLYTGYDFDCILNDPVLMSIMRYVDVVVDGKFDINLADNNYHWAGSTNQRVIDVQKSIKSNKVVLYI